METELSTGSLRSAIKEVAKRHKASWIELGQYLFGVHKDKMYREWDYLSFETYCVKELGIKLSTAQKILKSYNYLEKEEPAVVERPHDEEGPSGVPDYESVNLLRLAQKNENITPTDFREIRNSVIDEAREPKEVRAQVKKIIEEATGGTDEERQHAQSVSVVKRLVTSIKSSIRQLKDDEILPNYLIEQIEDVRQKLEDQLTDI